MFADGSATIECRDIPEFINEAGGHRWQELSGTGKKARIHTSTVTCSVLMDADMVSSSKYDLRDDEHFSFRTFSGTGAGGQHRNKKQCSVVMTHIPTGFQQKAESRSLGSNMEEAKAKLIALLDIEQQKHGHATMNTIAKKQIGLGQRGDKFRTYRFQDDTIYDSRRGKSTSCKTFMKGDISRLW